MSLATSSVRPGSDAAALPEGVSISAIKPSIGSYISGYRFDGESVPDAFRSAMRYQLHNRGLVIFEPGTVTAANFTSFAGFLGEFFDYAGPHTPRAPDNPDATVISAEKDAHLRNHVWHADGGFRADAPAFTALFGKHIPDSGGDTMFSNAAYVYESLDPLFAQYLDSLKVIQSPDATGHITDRYLDPEEAAQARLRMPPFELPLVRVHPESGRKWVAVNESYVCYIKGVSRVHSQNILGILFDMIKSPEATCRIEWKQGALAVWDNRVVQHRAIKDYTSNAERVLYRCTMSV
ncbi:MAG: TauD/TfdA family dioxygenase [Alphaproteobacteria bacterium]|nr:TauD/TfdA family dioxygenase [Alphaproteobacteria bacterium]